MNKVSLTIESEVDMDTLEELLEILKSLIHFICTCEIHTNILEES
ncbi:hypothetical protein ES708_25585 [subsurface metagenome]